MSNNIPSRDTYIKQPDTNKLDTLFDIVYNSPLGVFGMGLQTYKPRPSTKGGIGGIQGIRKLSK